MNSKLLKDKVAIVTSFSRGIGFEISRDLAERGAANIICSSMVTAQKSAPMTLSEGKKAAMENSMKWWGDPIEPDMITASNPSEDFVFAIGNTIIIDGGTVML
jgi:hypothetical protein